MKKQNMTTLLGIALVVAIISTGLFYVLFVGKLSSSAGNGKSLVVAAKGLKAGLVLSAADLKPMPWPAGQVPSGMFEHAEDVVGSTLMDPLGEGEPVLASHLVSAKGVASGAIAVPQGMRAVSVHVTDSSGVLALLHAGQKVDVQAVVNRRNTPAESQVRTVLEGLQVLAVSAQPEQTSQGVNLPAITLLASPSDADILATADAGARIRLTLRNPLDPATRQRNPLTVDSVMHATSPAR